ncbi:MAG: cytochrome c nitrite reductase small subunit [Spirochaetota bacterium]
MAFSAARIIEAITPPLHFRLPLIIFAGVFTGLGAAGFYLSSIWSYASDSPSACVNCHIMGPQYATWAHSSHRERAHCNDCHVPHNNIANHYFFKAKDGSRHAALFTLRLEPQVIHIKHEGRGVVQKNCLRCHTHVNLRVMFAANTRVNKGRYCTDCHRDVPHGRVNSLASAPYAQLPLPGRPVPAWLLDMTAKDKE